MPKLIIDTDKNADIAEGLHDCYALEMDNLGINVDGWDDLPQEDRDAWTAAVETMRAGLIRPQSEVYIAIAGERQAQHETWGIQRHSWPEWMSILTEEVGEAAQAANKAHWGHTVPGLAELRTELVQTAAVAIQIIGHIDELLAGEVEGE